MRAWIDRINVFMKYKDLLIQLVSRDIKLKYRRSFLGYLWSVLTNDKIEKILYPSHQIIGIFRASHYIGHTAVQKVMIIHLVLRR